jgi:hypothetical protein
LCGCVVAMGLVLRERFNSVDSFCGMLGIIAFYGFESLWRQRF